MRAFVRNVGTGLYELSLCIRDFGCFLVRLLTGVSFAVKAAHRRNFNWDWGWEWPEAALLALSLVTGTVTWNILLPYLSLSGSVPQTALLLAMATTVTAFFCTRH